MENKYHQINYFFEQYERRFNDALQGAPPDIEAVTQSFADCFVEASPVGIICGKNDEQFRMKIPQGYEFYKKIGIVSMNILSKQIDFLDDFHVMVKVQWNSIFTKKDNSKSNIEFQVIYFLQVKDDNHKIFSYITGDEQKALKDHGMI
jgi:hypothetical protein